MKQVVLLKRSLYKKGGIEKNVWKIAERFTQRNTRVTIFTSSNKQKSHPVFHICSYKEQESLPSFCKIYQFNRFCKKTLKKEPADVIFDMDRTKNQTHIRAGNGVHKAYLLRRAKQEGLFKKILFKINPLHQIILSYEKASFENKKLQVLFVNSNLVKQEILQFYRVDPQKIHVIHNGVEWKEMESSFIQSFSQKEDFLKRYHLPLNGFYFLFIGNGYARKGLCELLHAFSKIAQEDIHLLVVGKDKSIPSYQKLAKQLNIQKNVHFFGPSQDVTPFYQTADVFVLPTHYDPFSNVVLEALAMGVFVITTKDNGAFEILTEENGLVVNSSQDVNELYYKLQQSLRQKKTKTSALNIRKTVQHRDYETQLDQLIDQVLT